MPSTTPGGHIEGVRLSSKYSRSQYLMEMGGNDYDNVTPYIHKDVQLSGIRKFPTVWNNSRIRAMIETFS
jgi:hypothetical protein